MNERHKLMSDNLKNAAEKINRLREKLNTAGPQDEVAIVRPNLWHPGFTNDPISSAEELQLILAAAENALLSISAYYGNTQGMVAMVSAAETAASLSGDAS